MGRGVVLWPAAMLALTALAGVSVVAEPTVAYLPPLAVGVALALSLSTPTLAMIAVASAVLLPGLANAGVLPQQATYLNLALVWATFAISLYRRERTAPLLRLIGLLAAAALFSTVAAVVEPARGLFYFALLAEPFVLIAAILSVDPKEWVAKRLQFLAIWLALIQIPFALIEFATHGGGDHVQGTLYGEKAGAHVMGGIALLGALALVYSGWRLRYPLAAALFLLPILADAKQVIFTFALGALLVLWKGSKVRFAVVAGAALVLVYAVLNLTAAAPFSHKAVDQLKGGKIGKFASGRVVAGELRASPVAAAFGLGPAESISRSAYLTTSLSDTAPLAKQLHFAPATLPFKADYEAHQLSGGGSSVNAGLSSLLGILGDLGLFGAAAYVLVAIAAVRLTQWPAARVGVVMLAALGLAFDWLEQPPFTLYVALLIALGWHLDHFARSGTRHRADQT